MVLSHAVVKPLSVLVLVLLAVFAGVVLLGSNDVNSQERQAAPAAVGAPGGKPILRAYAVQADAAAAMAARLSQQYARVPGVRIVADARRAQVLVLASADVHAQIGGQLRPVETQQPQPGGAIPGAWAAAPPTIRSVATGLSSAAAPAAATGRAAVVGQNVRQGLPLWNVTGSDLEAALLRTLGGRLLPTPGNRAELGGYELRLPSGQTLRLGVNRQSNRVDIEGPNVAVASASQLIHALDHAQQPAGREIGLVSLETAKSADVAPLVQVLADQVPAQNSAPAAGVQMAQASGQPGDAAPQPESPTTDETAPGGSETTRIVPLPGGIAPPEGADGEGLIGPVQIEILEGLDVLVIRGHQRDVRRVMQIIEQIEQLAAETKPTIEIIQLRHVESVALSTLLTEVYSEVFAARLGTLSITPLGKPNALLLIGREETIAAAKDLIARLDQPVPPAAQFQVFRLKSLPAEEALTQVEAFFTQQQQQQGTTQGSLAPQVQVVADFRSNSVVVRGSPRELAEVAALLERIDTGGSEAINQVRVFKLRNSLADTLAPVLQDAITGQIYGQRSQRGAGAFVGGGGGAAGQQQDYERKSSRLQFITVDASGRQVLNSGILTDAQVTADTRTNALVVTASGESMPLIAALIEQLDQPSDIEAQVKVFTLVNSDATDMSQMLQNMFGQAQAGGTDTVSVRTGMAGEDTSLVGLRFAVDARTNSIIVTGSSGALTVVEAILLRLDESDVRNRKTTVYRLKNAPAVDVANALNEYLRSERQIEQSAEGLLSAFEQIEREVIVVPEEVSNSLIVSATPRFYAEITALVQELDERPPMVMIQVLIAELALTDFDEFGVELGLQDSILFDRSVVTGTGAASTLTPGYNFNGAALGNSGSAQSLANSQNVGGQGVTNLGTGRVNSGLGFGGLVLSASSESVNVLIRALQQRQRLEILSRPQVMTMDNQLAQIFVGQDVPTITNTQLTQFGTVNSIEYRQVGLILTVTPRISPDRLVVMEIQAEKSRVGAEADGIPIAVSEGQVIRSPRFDTATTRTVVSAMDGQTIVLSGLITKTNSDIERGVPYLSEVPVLKHLFQYKQNDEKRAELLIVMTPRIVESVDDAETIKRVESSRMHWCLSDVLALHDVDGLSKSGPTWYDGNSAVIYPDLDPTLKTMPELHGAGDGPEIVPTPAVDAPPAGPPGMMAPGVAPPPQPTLAPLLPDSLPPPGAVEGPMSTPPLPPEPSVLPPGQETRSGPAPLGVGQRSAAPGSRPTAAADRLSAPHLRDYRAVNR